MEHKSNLENYRPVVFWSLNDKLQNGRIAEQFNLLLKAGISGGFLHSRVGLVTEYLSDEWMKNIKYACQFARENDTSVWLYDEDRFPSGYAGGKVLEENDAFRTKALCLIESEKLSEYRVLKKYREVSDNGKDYIIALCEAQDGNPNFEGKCYVDLLNPKTTDTFLNKTHEAYKKNIGEYFGKEVKGIFSDEFCYTQKAAFKCPNVPFTVGLEHDFFREVGYDITEKMETLFFDCGDYHTVRRDFYEFLTHRFINSFTKPYEDWCKKNNLIFTGHLLNEDTLTLQTEWIGAAMPHYLYMGMPGVDKLGSDRNYLTTVKQLTSVCEQFGKRALCEAFACSGHQFGPGGIKRVSDWLCVLGINFINPHLTQYSIRGERKRDCPPDLSDRQPWFSVSENCFNHIARVCSVIDGDVTSQKVLMIHPIQSVWAEYSPLHKPNPVFSIWSPKNPNAGQNFLIENEHFEKPFVDLSEKLVSNGIFYHYGDEMIISENAVYSENGIKIGKCCYRQVVVPPVAVLKESTAILLSQLANDFGKDSVIFIKEFPNVVKEISEQFTLVSSVDEAVRMISAKMSPEISVRDVYTNRFCDSVYFRETEKDGQRSIFMANVSEERPYSVKVTLPISFVPTFWDTVADKTYRATGTLGENGFTFRANFKIGGSLMILETPSKTDSQACCLQSGVEFLNTVAKPLGKILYPFGLPDRGNLLPLDVVDYSVCGKTYHHTPLEFLWHNSFYKLKNGTDFSADYNFFVQALPQKSPYALIEAAENLDEILLNGQPLKYGALEPCPACFKGLYKAFLLDGLKCGENIISIRGKKCNNINGVGSHLRIPQGTEHRPTELETVFIYGDFSVAEMLGGNYTIAEKVDSVVGSTVDAGYPFYNGVLKYTLQAKQGCNFIRVNADGAAVRLLLRGKPIGVSYTKPFEFSLCEELSGNENLTVELYGSLENTFGPLHLANRDKLAMVGPIYFVDPIRYIKKPILFDFGIKSVEMIKLNYLEEIL